MVEHARQAGVKREFGNQPAAWGEKQGRPKTNSTSDFARTICDGAFVVEWNALQVNHVQFQRELFSGLLDYGKLAGGLVIAEHRHLSRRGKQLFYEAPDACRAARTAPR